MVALKHFASQHPKASPLSLRHLTHTLGTKVKAREARGGDRPVLLASDLGQAATAGGP